MVKNVTLEIEADHHSSHLFRRLKQEFYSQDVSIYSSIKECDVCQRYTFENVVVPVLLQPLPISNKVWQDMSIISLKAYLKLGEF